MGQEDVRLNPLRVFSSLNRHEKHLVDHLRPKSFALPAIFGAGMKADPPARYPF